ncbi:MAG TPA: TonB family protein [Thermodesulfobacteriota bacterium]|nr:TonB family protein [Thermodesulfobacteriota bacterium]
MNRVRGGRQPHSRVNNRDYADTGGLLKTGFFSFLLHITLAVILILSTRSTIPKIGQSVYRVTIRSFSPKGDGTPLGSPIPGPPGRTAELPASPPGEKLKPVLNQKGAEKAEATKSHQKKAEKKVENVEKGWSLEKGKSSLKSIQEAIEDIDKKAALEEIQKKVARRERSTRLSPGTTVSGAGAATGSGTGSGPAGSPSGGSPWGSSSGGSSALESRLSDYYSAIWAKIKKEWTLPGDLPKGKTDLEAVIVVIVERDGKVQKSSFEKRSGNARYDQSAMRAIKKAEPLPPIPKEFSDETFEIGIRFHQE